MKFKLKFAVAVLTAVLILPGGVNAADYTMTASAALNGTSVTVTGTTTLPGERPVAMAAFAPDAAADSPFQFALIYSQNGIINYSFKIDADAKSGVYTVKLSSAQAGVSCSASFEYVNQGERLESLMKSLNTLTAAASFESALAEAVDLTESPYADDYAALDASRRAQVRDTLLTGKPYVSLAAVASKLEEGIILATINQAGYPENKALIVKYRALIGVSLTGDGINGTKEGTLMKAVAARLFNTYGELKKYIEDALNAPVVTNPGGGGGGGGSFYSPMIPPTVTEVQEPPANPSEPTEPFTDMGEARWAADSIGELYKRGVVSGVGGGRFEPLLEVKREELVKMLALAFKLPQGGASGFTDAERDSWYDGYLSAALEAGLVTGYPDGSFGVGENVSRQDMAVMLYRAAKKFGVRMGETNEDVRFEDDGEIENYAREAVYAMRRAGIISGVGGNRFAPLETADRAMTAKVVCGVLNNQ